MSDLDLYRSGEVAPYHRGDQPLAPTAEDNWGQEVDYHTDQQHSSPQFFGTPLPPGSTQEHVERALGEIAGVFTADMARLGHPGKFATAATAWLYQTAMQPPRREPKRHSYNLFDQAGDPIAESFGNAMARVNAPQEFVSNAIWWIEELERQQGQQVMDHDQQPWTAPSSADPLDQLSDEQYARVVAANDRAKASTLDYLRDLWGSSFAANLSTVNAYFQSLPIQDQEYLGQMTSGYISGLNTKEILIGLYNQAIGAGSIGNVAEEIAAIEKLMVTDRKSYMKDDRMQMRLRELYRRRGY